jgi:hypothetical protein
MSGSSIPLRAGAVAEGSSRLTALSKLGTVAIALAAVALMIHSGLRVFEYTRNIMMVRRGATVSVAGPGGEALKVPSNPVLPLAGGSRLDLSGATAIVFVYRTTCRICDENMPRWLDLIADARRQSPGIPVYAVSLDSTAADAAIPWRGLTSAVHVVMPASFDDVRRAFGSTRTPATLVLRDGAVRSIHSGVVGDWRRQYMLAQLRGAQ